MGRPVRLRFRGVRVFDPALLVEREVSGPVDFARFGSCTFELTQPDTGRRIEVQGLCLLVSEIDGVAVDKRLNVVAKRLIERLRPSLESGTYLKLAFTITKLGERPRSTFSVTESAV